MIAAIAMSASVCMIALGGLVGIAVWWVADRRGERRPRRHRVRSKRTRPSSRGRRPYRAGRVRL